MSNIVIRTSKYKTKRRNYILLYYIVVKKKLQKLHIFAELAKKKRSSLFHQSYIIFAYTFCGYVGGDDVKTSNLHDLLYL